MIQGNELKLGNLVLRGLSEDVRTITAITEQSVYMNESLGATLFEDLKPIPLTEEWFDMFEFEKTEPVNAKLHPYPDYLKDGVIISLPYFEFTYNDGDNSRVLKYVHELMNLYYILTGEELEVKL